MSRTLFPGALAVGLLAAFSTSVSGQNPDPLPFRMERLSERVLLFTEISPMENLVLAMATEKGLVVVDATGSSYTASLLREAIVREFGRDDFAYLVHTHFHWDHAWGNAAFPEALVVAHQGARALLETDRGRLADMVSYRRENLREVEAALATLAAGAEEREALEVRRAFEERSLRGLEGGFTTRSPDITFTDRLEIDLGDVTLRLMYFGRAHSGNDVLIQIPEEELLLTGDLFLDIGWLPLFAGMPVLDIPRWIDVLSTALDEEAPVARVVPGHRQVWSREKLELWRDYIVELWDGVNGAREHGATLQEALERFTLDARFDYLRGLGHTEEELSRFQRENVEAFWRQISG